MKAVDEGAWLPAFLRSLTPLKGVSLPSPDKMVSFSFDFLQFTFKGVEHSPGLFYVPKRAGSSILHGRTFYAIDATNEPYLPSTPGQHGAKLTAFFNIDEPSDGSAVYENVPLFISASKWGDKTRKNNEYLYFGTYSQTRWSDKLSYNDVNLHVPMHVKKYWAEQLADPARPKWVTKALMKHFYHMPEYDGTLPSSMANGSGQLDEVDAEMEKKMEKDVKDFVTELRYWEKEASMGIALMKKEEMLKAFESVRKSFHSF